LLLPAIIVVLFNNKSIIYVLYSDLSYISGHCLCLCTAAVELQLGGLRTRLQNVHT